MHKVSYSQYSMWANCPKAWELKYVQGHRVDDTSINTIFGQSMHEVIQEWLDVLYNKSETMAKSVYLHEGFKDKLLTLFKDNTLETDKGKVFLSDKQTLMEYYEQGCQILDYVQQNYKKLFPTKNVRLYAIEFPLEVEVKPGVLYIGYIDIVTHNTLTDKYVIYDLKTSRRGWSEDEKKSPIKVGQLLLYKTFFAHQLGVSEDQISVEFIILKRTIFENSPYPIPRVSKFEPPNKGPSLVKNWDRFEKFINKCFDDEGNTIPVQEATPSKDACKWCKYKTRKDLCSFGV